MVRVKIGRGGGHCLPDRNCLTEMPLWTILVWKDGLHCQKRFAQSTLSIMVLCLYYFTQSTISDIMKQLVQTISFD